MHPQRLRNIKTNIDFDSLTTLLALAEKEGRYGLFEHEAYQFLEALGAETPPRAILMPAGESPAVDILLSMPGEQVVLKIVSPTIAHKTEVGGVRVVGNKPNTIRSGWRRMLSEVPEKYVSWLGEQAGEAPLQYQGLDEASLQEAVRGDIVGVLLVEFMAPDSEAFGNELIVGLRNTREFGMVLSAGLGGTDTELYAEFFRKNRAIVSACTAGMDGARFFHLFSKTISYKKLMGLTRGQKPIVSDEQLVECFAALIEVGNYFSYHNPEAPYIIDELEINPFAFSDYCMVPLDGLLRFSRVESLTPARPIAKIEGLLHPQSIGITGVSPTRKNFGRIILENVIAAGFPRDDITVIHPDSSSIDGVTCVADLAALSAPLDLFVVAIGSEQVSDLIDQVLKLKAAHSVLLIPGGLGETEATQERAQALTVRLQEAHAQQQDGGPIILGPNSMGIVSHPGRYDTWFLPEEKLPKQGGGRRRNIAFVSQSGAFMGTRLSNNPELDPAYLISLGNQSDLTFGDFMLYFKDSAEVNVIAVYAEGFNDLDGAVFAEAVRDAVAAGKEVVFYKAGRTPEGQLATSSHTASLAGEYVVCESCLTQAGAVVAQTLEQFMDLLTISSCFHATTIRGKRIAGFSSAGFEAVGIADYIHSDDYDMELAPFSAPTRSALEELMRSKKLDQLVTVANPLDINPGADDSVFASVIEILDQEQEVDVIIAGLVPLSPSMHSLADGSLTYRQGIIGHITGFRERISTPLVVVVDGGRMFDPFADDLEALDIPVFRSIDRAMVALSLYTEARVSRSRYL